VADLHEWELIEKGDTHGTWRMGVPGGWLYRLVYWDVDPEKPSSACMTFVPRVTPSMTCGGR
jgi:hypothetical protein